VNSLHPPTTPLRTLSAPHPLVPASAYSNASASAGASASASSSGPAPKPIPKLPFIGVNHVLRPAFDVLTFEKVSQPKTIAYQITDLTIDICVFAGSKSRFDGFVGGRIQQYLREIFAVQIEVAK
jgi:hypothetical protein